MESKNHTDLDELKKKVISFRDERDWKKYHSPKNLSISIAVESSELLELFQWNKNISEIEEEDIKDEIADIMIYLLYLSEATGIDIPEAVMEKIEKNEERYPKDGSENW